MGSSKTAVFYSGVFLPLAADPYGRGRAVGVMRFIDEKASCEHNLARISNILWSINSP